MLFALLYCFAHDYALLVGCLNFLWPQYGRDPLSQKIVCLSQPGTVLKYSNILQVGCCGADLLILWMDIYGLKAKELEGGRLLLL